MMKEIDAQEKRKQKMLEIEMQQNYEIEEKIRIFEMETLRKEEEEIVLKMDLQHEQRQQKFQQSIQKLHSFLLN